MVNPYVNEISKIFNSLNADEKHQMVFVSQEEFPNKVLSDPHSMTSLMKTLEFV